MLSGCCAAYLFLDNFSSALSLLICGVRPLICVVALSASILAADAVVDADAASVLALSATRPNPFIIATCTSCNAYEYLNEPISKMSSPKNPTITSKANHPFRAFPHFQSKCSAAYSAPTKTIAISVNAKRAMSQKNSALIENPSLGEINQLNKFTLYTVLICNGASALVLFVLIVMRFGKLVRRK